MIAIDFPQRNVLLAENQPEYETVPVFVEMQEIIVPNGPSDPQLAIMTKSVPWVMTACFQLNKEELDALIATGGKFWYRQSVFGSNFQPMNILTQNPFE